GTFDVRRVMLYGYTFSLSSARTLKSITLPANRNVVVLAMSLGPAAPSTTMHAIQKPATFWMLPKAKQE
ncbi:MAG TPA: hypothetical protein VFW44_05580, partial [Bryobacteraceae bacterium]|nr:hypothetical protein [Bryobacteraceae bacterium]